VLEDFINIPYVSKHMTKTLSWDSVVTSDHVTEKMIQGSNPGRGKRFSFPQNAHTAPADHPASYSKSKVKLSLHRPGQALGVPGG
jgi:hypothetical protein